MTTRILRRVRQAPGPLLVAVVALVAAGFGPFAERARPGAAGPPTIRVTLSEYAIRLSTTSPQAGFARVVVSNRGKVPHELTAVRTDRPVDQLPVADGEVWGAADVVEVGAIHFGSHEHTAWGFIDFEPGRYVLFCNMKGHYEAGMRTVLTVK